MNKVIIAIVVGVGAAVILAFLVRNSTPQWSVNGYITSCEQHRNTTETLVGVIKR